MSYLHRASWPLLLFLAIETQIFLFIGNRERRALGPFALYFFLAVEVFIIDVYRERYPSPLARLLPLAEKEIMVIELIYSFMNAMCQISVSISRVLFTNAIFNR